MYQVYTSMEREWRERGRGGGGGGNNIQHKNNVLI